MKIILFVISFITGLYLFTISDTIFGGDSGDLVSAVLTAGSAHPPGYPLYVLLGIFFNNLPLNFLSTAGRVTLTSTISSLFSFVLFFLVIKEITGKKFLNYYLSSLTLLVISFNYLIWLYAVVPEVFPLNTLITLALFYFAVKFYKTLKNKYLYFIALFIGLGISHHHTFILVLPSIAYLLYKKRKEISIKTRTALSFILSFLIGILPLGYLIYTGFAKSEILWGQTNTINGFFSTLLRLKYGSFLASSQVLSIPQARINQIRNLFSFVLDDFNLIGVILFVLGIFFFIKYRKTNISIFLNAIIINIFLFGPFFVFYANFPLISGYYFATIERFLIVFYFFFALLVYFGLYFLVYDIVKPIIKSYITNSVLKRLTLASTLILILIYPAGLFLKSYPIIHSLKNDKTAENLGRDVLNSIPDNSILLLGSDNFTFNTQYVESSKPRKNIVLVHIGKFGFFDYKEILKYRNPQLKFNQVKNIKDPLRRLIYSNKDSMNVYTETPLDIVKIDGYVWTNQGMVYKLEKIDQVNKDQNLKNIRRFWKNSLNKDLSQQIEEGNLKFKNFFTADILKIYADGHKNTASYMLDNNLLEEAHEHIQETINLEQLDPELNTYKYLSIYYEKRGECKKAENTIDRVLKESVNIASLKQLSDLTKNCYKNDKDKKRIDDKIKQYLKKNATLLEQF